MSRRPRKQSPAKRLWAKAFELEQSLYSYVYSHCEELYSQTNPAFNYTSEGKKKPPKFIRWVGKLRGESQGFLDLTEQLKTAYQAAMGDEFKTYPARFPQFYEKVEAISVTTNYAYKSWRLKPETKGEHKGFIKIKSEAMQGQTIEEYKAELNSHEYAAKRLSAIGLKSVMHVQRLLGVPPTLEVFVEAESLYDYFGTDHIQARQKTGRHYRARIRFLGDSAGERCPLGFMVLNADSPIQKVAESIKQAERPHTLLSQGRILEWPTDILSLDYAIFDKSI